MTLHGTDIGIKATVGYTRIVLWPFPPRIGASNEIHANRDLAQLSGKYSSLIPLTDS